MTMTPEESKSFRQTIQNLARAEFQAFTAAAEEKGGRDRAVFGWAAEHNLLGLSFPTEVGGGGGTKEAATIVAEELAYVDAGLSGMITGQSSVATEAILRHGDPEQKRRYLEKIFTGSAVMGIAITEPDTGSNIAGTRTTATSVDDGYLLNGSKTFISYAGIADHMTVVARLVGTEGKEGLGLFIVNTDEQGYVLGRNLKKLGQKSSDTGEFVLDNAFVPAENVIGEIGDGFKYVQESLTSGRIDYSARAVGVAQACLDEALDYAKVRAPFGKPIVSYQATQFKLARMALAVDSSRVMTLRAATSYDSDPQSTETVLHASMAKLHSSESVQDVSWESLQIHGAYGYIDEFRIEKLFRDARLFTLSEGTSEIQLLHISRLIGARP